MMIPLLLSKDLCREQIHKGITCCEVSISMILMMECATNVHNSNQMSSNEIQNENAYKFNSHSIPRAYILQYIYKDGHGVEW